MIEIPFLVTPIIKKCSNWQAGFVLMLFFPYQFLMHIAQTWVLHKHTIVSIHDQCAGVPFTFYREKHHATCACGHIESTSIFILYIGKEFTYGLILIHIRLGWHML